MIATSPVHREARLPVGAAYDVTDGIACLPILLVNVFFVGRPGTRDWVLVDAGLPGSARRIEHAAMARFCGPPRAIVLTHGHFDHVGAVRELASRWGVPVYAHALEAPYLTGQSKYPPPDPTVGGGIMASSAFLYPRGPIDLGNRLRLLPGSEAGRGTQRGEVPDMPGWEWVHTPGHTPGHVSLFRAADRALLAGDAFVTTKQESLLAVMTQHKEIHGPPMYYTPDWESAWESVQRLAALEPEIAATGHGLPIDGPRLREGLHRLAEDFPRLAMPARCRYVRQAAISGVDGVEYIPPRKGPPRAALLAGLGAVALGAAVLARRGRR
jgi:glyoxylase-like metal-dependent hydrolase (beta-lactamase superfamily II)